VRLGLADILGHAALRQGLIANIQMREVLSARSINFPACETTSLRCAESSRNQSGQMQRSGLDLLEKIAGTLPPDFPGLWRAHKQIKAIQLLPQFHRDLISNHPGIFARLKNRRYNRIGILNSENKEFGHGLSRGIFVKLQKGLLIARTLNNRIQCSESRSSLRSRRSSSS